MSRRNTRESYGLVSKLLHALVALLMFVQIPVGWYMAGLSDESIVYWRFLELHEVLGLTVLVLIIGKVLWRMVSPNPEISPALAGWERAAARVVHSVFIFALAFIPVLGFLYVASDGEPINLYDLVEIPSIGQFGKDMRNALFGLHRFMAYSCAVLIVVHILAAFKHHFIDGHGSLRRIAF